MDCSLPGSSLHGILLARILEWVDISSSRESSRPRDWTHIFYGSCIGRQILYHWATWEAQVPYIKWLKNNRNLFLTVLEAGSSRSRCQHGQMGALSLVFLVVSLRSWRGWGCSLEPLLWGHQSQSWGLYPYDLIIFQRPLPPHRIILGG